MKFSATPTEWLFLFTFRKKINIMTTKYGTFQMLEDNIILRKTIDGFATEEEAIAWFKKM